MSSVDLFFQLPRLGDAFYLKDALKGTPIEIGSKSFQLFPNRILLFERFSFVFHGPFEGEAIHILIDEPSLERWLFKSLFRQPVVAPSPSVETLAIQLANHLGCCPIYLPSCQQETMLWLAAQDIKIVHEKMPVFVEEIERFSSALEKSGRRRTTLKECEHIFLETEERLLLLKGWVEERKALKRALLQTTKRGRHTFLSLEEERLRWLIESDPLYQEVQDVLF